MEFLKNLFQEIRTSTTNKYKPPRRPIMNQGPIPVYLCTDKHLINSGRYYVHIPLLFVAVGAGFFLYNLSRSPVSIFKAFLWLIPTGFFWMVRSGIREASKVIVKKIELT